MRVNSQAKSITRVGNMTEFADPKLYGDYSFEAFELVFKLALSCTGLKQQRPLMQEVVTRLEEALDITMRANSVRPAFYS